MPTHLPKNNLHPERPEATRPCLIVAVTCFAIFPMATSVANAQIQTPATRDAETADSDFFTTSGTCALCHSSAPHATALRDAKGRSVAPVDLWPTSMMANSSVDPLWRAVVAAEVAATPSRKAQIEAKCLKCHTPMASVEAEFANTTPSRAEFLHGNSTLTQLAADGVSCTVCHQIPADALGSDESFSGHFTIAREGKIFGPHPQPFAMPMYRHTGYVPTESGHVRKSGLCAACHTLFTNPLDPDGTPTGHTLLEQGPYVEWQNSHFNDELESPHARAASCQDCHVPATDLDGTPIKTRIARNPHGFDFPPVRPREFFGRHVFVGGNTLIPSMIRAELAKTESQAGLAEFDAAIAESRHMLRHQTAQIEIEKATQHDGALSVEVAVTNLAGHKLPTAYPSRRVWIRLRVLDAAGQLVFASGEFDDRGRLVDAAGHVLPEELAGGPATPHQSRITSPTQVQIYEAVMQDAAGQVTYSLLRGAAYAKDNRLLPAGWTTDHPRGPITTPVGTADDTDFKPGSDRVRYRLTAPARRGPYQVEATLHYQVLGSRYAAELFTHDVPEMNHFRKLHDAVDPRPELLDRKVQTVNDAPSS